MALTSTTEKTSAQDVRLDHLSVIAAALTLALVPVARGWVLWSAPGSSGDVNQWVTTSPFDWPLAMLVALQLASVLESRRGSSTTRIGSARLPLHLAALTASWMVLAALVHPSWRAVDLLFHVVGAWALVRTLHRSTHREQTALLVAMVVLGVVQAALGIAQSRVGDAIGLGVLEFEGPLYTFGTTSAGRGSLTHPYHLTALLVTAVAAAGVLADRLRSGPRTLVLLGLCTMAVAIPLTFSRASVLAVVPMVLLWGRRPDTRSIAGALLAGLLVGALLGANGISAKAERTADLDAADSGRRQRAAEAFGLVEEEPVFGVGPGRYVVALRDFPHEDLLPPHNVVLHTGAESGLPGGFLTLATLGAFALWVLRRRSVMALAVAVSLLPFHLLDSYPHVFPMGWLITGMWLGLLAVVVSDHRLEAARP